MWWLLQDGEVDGEREDTVDSDFSLGIRSQAFAAGPPKMERSQVYRVEAKQFYLAVVLIVNKSLAT